jgi:hypothetical protein
VTAAELRAPAKQEADELGPEPRDPRDREIWQAERHGAVVLLASLAEWDAALLRRAALEEAGEWTNRAVRDLLLDAAQERR